MQIGQSSGRKRIIVGAATTKQSGWEPTDKDTLDLLHETSWRRYFTLDSIDAIMAEHVWEHLTLEQGQLAAKNCFKFLKPGGYARIAVPDGFHPESTYIDAVKPGGNGAGSHDHKLLYTYQILSEVFTSVGFRVELKEYFDENNVFIEMPWNPTEGMIVRSKQFDARNKDGRLAYTSIILDAVKPS